MARARNIKPAFFKNYDLADAGPVAQLLFAGLWCLADREGRLEDKPRLIKAELFPYYDCDVNGELTVLERLGFVRRYVSAGVSVIEVLNFKKHQAPHNTEKASILPPFDPETGLQAAPSVANGEVTVNPPLENDGKNPDSLIPDSPILIPDSPKPPKGEASPQPDPKPAASPAQAKAQKPDAMEGFAEFWMRYPKKKSKSDAEKAWAKLKPNAELRSVLMTALGEQVRSRDWIKNAGQYIPLPATWLNGKRWEDENAPELMDNHHGFNGERDYTAGLEDNGDGTYGF